MEWWFLSRYRFCLGRRRIMICFDWSLFGYFWNDQSIFTHGNEGQHQVFPTFYEALVWKSGRRFAARSTYWSCGASCEHTPARLGLSEPPNFHIWVKTDIYFAKCLHQALIGVSMLLWVKRSRILSTDWWVFFSWNIFCNWSFPPSKNNHEAVEAPHGRQWQARMHILENYDLSNNL